MARLFGALANAGAQVNTNRFKRQQYDDQQAAQARDEARRVFEFAATQDRLKEQAALQAQARKDALARQSQEDVVDAQLKGYEDAVPESVAGAASAFLQSQGMGMPSQPVRMPAQKPYETQVEGIKIGGKSGGAPRYATVGGRAMRYNPQTAIDNTAKDEERKLLEQFAMKRDVAGQLAADKDARRAELQAIINAGRPQPQRRTQIVKDDATGEYVVVDMDQIGATGLKVPKTVAGGAAAAKAKSEEPMRAALKDIASQVLAQAQAGGGLPAPSVMESYLADKKGDYKAGSLSRTLAKAGYAATAGPSMQKAQNFVDQVGSVLLPLRGGKAITQGEKEIIMGAVTVAPGETPDMRAQKLHAFEMLVAPVIASGGGDINQVIAEMRQRAQSYRPKSVGTTTKQAAPSSVQQGETREQRIKRLSGSRS